MAKISKKEYKELKALDDGWKWIARDGSGELYIHGEKPEKFATDWVSERDYYLYLDDETFQLIQWEDDEPYNIAELIEEYEYSADHMSHIVNERVKALGKAWSESEETEVNSKQDLIEKWESAIESAEFYGKGKEEELISYMKDFVSDLKQLDESEITEEQAWEVIEGKYGDEVLQNNIDYVERNGYLVKEKPTIPQFVFDWIEKCKEVNVLDEIFYLENSTTSQNMREEHKVYFWLKENFDDFAKAWLSYPDVEIEEEKRYYVLFGNQFHDDNWTYALTNSGSIEIFEKDVLPEWDMIKLTEQEIKDYDPRCWIFRKPVEEVEEDGR